MCLTVRRQRWRPGGPWQGPRCCSCKCRRSARRCRRGWRTWALILGSQHYLNYKEALTLNQLINHFTKKFDRPRGLQMAAILADLSEDTFGTFFSTTLLIPEQLTSHATSSITFNRKVTPAKQNTHKITKPVDRDFSWKNFRVSVQPFLKRQRKWREQKLFWFFNFLYFVTLRWEGGWSEAEEKNVRKSEVKRGGWSSEPSINSSSVRDFWVLYQVVGEFVNWTVT